MDVERNIEDAIEASPETCRVEIPVAGSTPLLGEWHPAEASPGPALLWLPAMGVPARYYRPFATALARLGVSVLVLELRGQGDNRPRNGRKTDHGYRFVVDNDIPAALAVLGRLSDREGPLLGGHSLGGHLALLHAAVAPASLAGLVLIASQMPYYRFFEGRNRLRALFGSQVMALVSSLRGFWPGDRLGFGGRQPRRLIHDWARLVRTGRWSTVSGNLDFDEYVKRLAMPVLAIDVDDDVDAPGSAMDAMCRPLVQASVTRRTYHARSSRAGGHFRWARGGAEPVAALVTEWLERTGQLTVPTVHDEGGAEPAEQRRR